MAEATSEGMQKSEENQVVWFVPVGVYHNYNENILSICFLIGISILPLHLRLHFIPLPYQ